MNQGKRKIRTHGSELVLFGVIAFAVIIGATLAVYRMFIVGRVRDSDEFRAASYFAAHSPSIKDKILSPIESLRFDGIEVSEQEGFGVCEIGFRLRLKDDIVHELRVGLVKAADFWIVYDAVLDPGEPNETAVASTYQKILLFLEKIDFQEYPEAEGLLGLIKAETNQSALQEFLSAYLNVSQGNEVYALQALTDLGQRLSYARLAVMYVEALLHYNRRDYGAAIAVLKRIEETYAADRGESGSEDAAEESLFEDLPKDPFLVLLEPDDVVASSRKLLSLVYNYEGDYENGLKWAGKAIEQAEKIESSVIRSSAVYLKALNLYSLGRYEKADAEFSDVISDLDNPNLSQKAWAYYFKADIAARFARHADALDYYETAVALDPSNAIVRKGAIEYLVGRNYVGDLEIALGLAIRGMDYGAEKPDFKELAARLYARLGLADQTPKME